MGINAVTKDRRPSPPDCSGHSAVMPLIPVGLYDQLWGSHDWSCSLQGHPEVNEDEN